MPEQIVEILNCVREDRWNEKLREIKKGIDEYEKCRSGQSSISIDQIVERYLNPILPTYWKVFHTHNIHRQNKGFLPSSPCYDIGIFLVGFSSLPIALSLAEIQPCHKIYFLHSGKTDYIIPEIEERVATMVGGDCIFDPLINLVRSACHVGIDRPSDPVDTFKQIKDIIGSIGGEKTIALDLTGGKKTMIGGSFTAGAIFGFADSIGMSVCDMFYVDSLEYDETRGAPKPGTEFLSLLENPYDIYNLQTVQSAEELFRKHNYEAAESLWKGVTDKLDKHGDRYGLAKEKAEVEKRRKLAHLYHLWDAFYYVTAQNYKKKQTAELGYDEKHVHCSIDVLNILSEARNRQLLFQCEERIIHSAIDRYQNAIRRKESGKLADAIVRFTQVIEVLCVYEIRRIAIKKDLQDENCDKVTNPPKKWHIIPLIKFLFGEFCEYRRSEGGHYKISDSNQLLKIDEYPGSVTEIVELIDYRNDFIHVDDAITQPKTKENAQKLQRWALRFLANFSKDYCKEQCMSFKNLLKLHRFRQQQKIK